MADEIGDKIQGMFRTIFTALDIKYMRPIKREMFKCSIECLDERNSASQVTQCVEDCGSTTHHAMVIMQQEMNAFQGRIDRCLMDCQDGVRDERDEVKARRLFDECASRCVERLRPEVPSVIKILCEKLDILKKDSNIQ